MAHHTNTLYLIAILATTFIISSNSQSCTDAVTCNSNGLCETSNNCKCDLGYVTYESSSSTYCNYEQLKQHDAFLWHFFLGAFGAGRFYVGSYTKAAFQLSLCVFGVCFGFLCWFYGAPFKNANVYTDPNDFDEVWDSMKDVRLCKFGGILSVVCSIVMISIWWIIDCVLFGLNQIHDGNDIPLAPW